MIDLTDNSLAELFQNIHVDISEYCFSNMFCFQHDHNFEYTTISELPFAFGESTNLRYLMPLFKPSSSNIQEIKNAMKAGYALYPIDESWLTIFQADSDFVINSYEKDFDYVYLQEKLELLPGRKLSKKRNLIAQFNNSCQEISVKTFSSDAQKDAITILDEWANDATDNKDDTDHAACLLGINNFASLNLSGIVVYSQGRPIAFTLGELLRDNYILHFAKANIHCKGAYQFLFKETAAFVSTAKWINFEQDLGKPQLKKMKESYYPDKIIKKYTISLTSNL
ncbi:MAG: phosphatidylglycerol lysyltransferase domain-containing protein [Candidatus Margulisbacteria bacterium]|nr:phosphatidylglycerol lysyltransferase domain-containing protein [Candidatus Margulisiibacteriota bacterium]